MAQGKLGSQGPAALIQRACTLQVADLSIPAGQGTGLDISFTVRRGVQVTQASTKPQPNTCDLKIWGLNPDHRKELSTSTTPTPGGKPKIIPCVLTAGYQGHQNVIFSGELRSANNVTEGPNKVTEMTTGDGDTALTQTRLNVVFAAGSTPSQFLDQILAALGITAENLAGAKQMLQGAPAAGQLFSKGAVFKGAASEIMSDFARSCGLSWSIQNGKLRLLQLNQPDSGTAILISDDPNTGLIGSPTVDPKGILSFEVEMLPDLIPGCKVSLDTEEVKGGFVVLSTTVEGDTLGDKWSTSCECKRY